MDVKNVPTSTKLKSIASNANRTGMKWMDDACSAK